MSLIRGAMPFCSSEAIRLATNRWYEEHVLLAEKIYSKYLQELKREGLIP